VHKLSHPFFAATYVRELLRGGPSRAPSRSPTTRGRHENANDGHWSATRWHAAIARQLSYFRKPSGVEIPLQGGAQCVARWPTRSGWATVQSLDRGVLPSGSGQIRSSRLGGQSSGSQIGTEAAGARRGAGLRETGGWMSGRA